MNSYDNKNRLIHLFLYVSLLFVV